MVVNSNLARAGYLHGSRYFRSIMRVLSVANALTRIIDTRKFMFYRVPLLPTAHIPWSNECELAWNNSVHEFFAVLPDGDGTWEHCRTRLFQRIWLLCDEVWPRTVDQRVLSSQSSTKITSGMQWMRPLTWPSVRQHSTDWRNRKWNDTLLNE